MRLGKDLTLIFIKLIILVGYHQFRLCEHFHITLIMRSWVMSMERRVLEFGGVNWYN